MSVYVDDNVITGPSDHELTVELGAILNKVPGRIITTKETTDKDGIEWMSMDFLG